MPLPLIPVKAGLIGAGAGGVVGGGVGLVGGWGTRDILDPIVDPPTGVISSITFLVIAVAILGLIYIFMKKSKII